jgi:hypothetical protein
MTTLKWTCDRDGNWRQVLVQAERVGSGWREVVVESKGRAA